MAKRKHRHPLGGLFTQAERRTKGAEKVTALDRLNQSIDWEAFRPALEQNLDYKHTHGTHPPQGGRPSYDHVLMFKILILQKAHALSTLLDERDTGITLYADSAYRSEAIEAALSELGIESQIHERAYRNTPLRKRQQQNNRRKSRIRARIEPICAHQRD
jgi:hypothetical protein